MFPAKKKLCNYKSNKIKTLYKAINCGNTYSD